MKKYLLLALVTLLSACESAPQGYQPKPFVFAPALRVNVHEIRVTDNAATSSQLPHVEQDFPTPLNTALKQWAAQRLFATPDAAAANILEISIEDATVSENKLHTKKGVEGMFYDEQDTRYDARIKVTMRLYAANSAMSAADGEVEVTRSRSVSEKATADERLRTYDQMAHDMLAIYDQQAELRLRQYFATYLK